MFSCGFLMGCVGFLSLGRPSSPAASALAQRPWYLHPQSKNTNWLLSRKEPVRPRDLRGQLPAAHGAPRLEAPPASACDRSARRHDVSLWSWHRALEVSCPFGYPFGYGPSTNVGHHGKRTGPPVGDPGHSATQGTSKLWFENIAISLW